MRRKTKRVGQEFESRTHGWMNPVKELSLNERMNAWMLNDHSEWMKEWKKDFRVNFYCDTSRALTLQWMKL